MNEGIWRAVWWSGGGRDACEWGIDGLSADLAAAEARVKGGLQPFSRAIRKAAPSVLSVAARLPLLIIGRSLRVDVRGKTRASTIFPLISTLAELF